MSAAPNTLSTALDAQHHTSIKHAHLGSVGIIGSCPLGASNSPPPGIWPARAALRAR